jgi:NAD(P)-dependent dehydrogenase (short-subunit alcohol dehydrogenase family)
MVPPTVLLTCALMCSCLFNAGIARDFFKATEDGLESTVQTNAVSTTWMALRALPLMKKTAGLQSGFKPHLTITGSE